MATSRQLDQATDIGVDSSPTPRRPSRRTGSSARRKIAIGCTVIAAVVAAAVLLATDRSNPPPDDATDPPVEATAAQEQATSPPEVGQAATDAATELTPVNAVVVEEVGDRLVIVAPPNDVFLLDFEAGTRTPWQPPEAMVSEAPVSVMDSVVVVGESQAWARSAFDSSSSWQPIGPADRVRYSTKPDRVWLRTLNIKTHPSDAEYLWNEVDLTGTVHRSMFRDRPLYMPTPEFVLGLGSNIFRFTDLEINPWRLFSPFGVPIAIGRNDLIANECNTRIECGRVWYDLGSFEQKQSVYGDLAASVQAEYGTRLSPDGRFLVSELRRPDVDSLAFVRSVAAARVVANNCRWDAPFSWSSDSQLFACHSDAGLELHFTGLAIELNDDRRRGTGAPQPLALIDTPSQVSDTVFSFVAPVPEPTEQ